MSREQRSGTQSGKTNTKLVYSFGKQTEGKASERDLLGGKGANLAEMCLIGLPVPSGFTITTDACRFYSEHGSLPQGLTEQFNDAMRNIEKEMGAVFGDAKNPLLLSCRSGARESMPGMMDTVLNIGLNDETVVALAKQSGNERFAQDSYRRVLHMFGNVVLGLKGREPDPFEHILAETKARKKVTLDTQLDADELRKLVKAYKVVIKNLTGKEFPQDPQEQIWQAVMAVFRSWNGDRACVYRRQYGIPDEWGTACNVMAMVFGNLGDDCATGVALTRDGSTGVPGICGDYLINAQGEDVVNGSRPTKRIETQLKQDMPNAHAELVRVGKVLEKHYKNMQDIEFTIQRNKLFMLQTRNAKRPGLAAVRVATDLVTEGLITKKEAISSKFVPAGDLAQLLQPTFNEEAKRKARERLLTKATAAGPGAATGKIVFSPERAEALKLKNPDAKLILVRKETTPEDLRGMKAALGILTAVGGVSSHAALVSRQMGKACIVGAGDLQIDHAKGTLSVKGNVLRENDDISIDGFTGEVFAGSIATAPSEVVQVLVEKTLDPKNAPIYQRFATLMSWAEECKGVQVRANADTPEDAAIAVAFGATGIGLCRSEHMFFNHLVEMRMMIMSETPQERQQPLSKMLGFQRDDFIGIFKAMAGRPVTIRLLDPPLHEFLPQGHAQQKELAEKMGISLETVLRRLTELHEQNPMLGHRGCRLGIVYPEITRMQARAIFEAAVQVKKSGIEVRPEVMIPLVGFSKEFYNQEAIIREEASAVFARTGVALEYLVGTMIELPRACVTANEIGERAEFFSFGTNDLTQTALGISRDDYRAYIGPYTDPKQADIFATDPFVSIDQNGVGQLMRMAVEKGRSARPDLKIGICGEHGGDPASVAFCRSLGLDYVSCSPFRVPVARLAAAQAELDTKAKK